MTNEKRKGRFLLIFPLARGTRTCLLVPSIDRAQVFAVDNCFLPFRIVVFILRTWDTNDHCYRTDAHSLGSTSTVLENFRAVSTIPSPSIFAINALSTVAAHVNSLFSHVALFLVKQTRNTASQSINRLTPLQTPTLKLP